MRRDDSAGEDGSLGPRALVLAVLGCSLVGRVVDANPHPSAAYLPFVLALYVLPLWYATGRRRQTWRRHAHVLLAGQAVLTYTPFVLFGSTWVGGVSGLLGALVLLTLRPAAGWILFALLGTLELGIWLVVGLPYGPAANAAFWLLNAFVITSLSGFALNRLADLLELLRGARARLVADAVARQRLAATRHLQQHVVQRLAALSSRASAVARSEDPRELHAGLEEVGVLARAAAADSRRLLLELPDPVAGTRAGSDDEVVVTPRLARGVTLAVVVLFAVQAALNVALSPPGSDWGPVTAALGVLAAATSVALTLWHLEPRADGERPRGWPLTWAAQAALVLGLYALTDAGVLSLWGLTVASGLALVRHPARWIVLAVGTIAVPALTLARPIADQESLGEQLRWSVYAAAIQATIGLMIYGMSRFMAASIAVRRAQQDMARTAATEEQLRLARDVHDTLGLGLATIALKSDLALGLEDRDPDRARAEVLRMTELALEVARDAQTVGTGSLVLDLGEELVNACSTLEAAGVEVDAAIDRPSRSEVSAVLAAVLREAVTNIVRHSEAHTCRIRLTVRGGTCELTVENDGARPPRGAAGVGLRNMQDRLEPWGGRLRTRRAGSSFVLTVTVPESEMITA